MKDAHGYPWVLASLLACLHFPELQVCIQCGTVLHSRHLYSVFSISSCSKCNYNGFMWLKWVQFTKSCIYDIHMLYPSRASIGGKHTVQGFPRTITFTLYSMKIRDTPNIIAGFPNFICMFLQSLEHTLRDVPISEHQTQPYHPHVLHTKLVWRPSQYHNPEVEHTVHSFDIETQKILNGKTWSVNRKP